MKLLVLGSSKLLSARVLPALTGHPEVRGVDLASRRGVAALAALTPPLPGERYGSFEEALARSDAEAVYVSTENSGHVRWAEAALRSGRHAIVDKPATPGPDEAARLAALAREHGRVVAEYTVFPFHPLFDAARARCLAAGPVRHLSAAFSFPPLPPDNFRNRRALGGGAVADLAVYALGPGRVFFDAAPERIEAAITTRGPEVETGFTLLATYPGGRTACGHFGFDTEYHNHLTVLGDRYRAEIPTAFTPPAGKPLTYQFRAHDREETVETPPGSGFGHFFTVFARSLRDGSGGAWAERMLADAGATARLRQALGLPPPCT